MARQRLISPEFFLHGELYEAEIESGLPVRLAFAALWCQADRRGVFVWKPRELKFACLPNDDVDFVAVLCALEAHGFVQSYTVRGRRYGVIPSFARWQTFHHRETVSKNPGPQDADADSVPFLVEIGAKPVTTRAIPEARPVPTRGQPGASPTVTVTVTGTVTGTGTVVSYVHAADGEHRTRLVTAANQGITAQYGEQTNPLRWDHKGTFFAAEQLEAASVPLDFACQQLFELAKTRTPSSGRPPRTLSYFAGAVVDAWKAEEAHRLAATSPTPVPSGGDETHPDPLYFSALRFAREGDASWQQYCRDRGWEWEKAS